MQMLPTPTAIITHPTCLLHEMGRNHPESPQRLESVLAALRALPHQQNLLWREANMASREALCAAHSSAHVDKIFSAAPTADYAYLDPDTSMNPHTLDAARYAAGAVIDAVDTVLAGDVHNAFCAVRPCGHHATRDQAMGFCFFNNVAVGAYHALQNTEIKRVAILDFDVHHGNGTEDIVQGDARMMLFSSFQFPYYPMSKANVPAANIVHTPLPAQTGSTAFRAAIDATWWQPLAAFDPDMIFISAGFDAHKDDPMAYFNLEVDDFLWVTQQIVQQTRAGRLGRVISVLEGGYDVAALGECAAAHVQALRGV
jgi:acetoin utilization deacetylase AcuC-like enzyme